MQLTAIIAGTGILPVEACKSLKTKNIPFFVISLFPEDNFDALEQLVETKNDIIKKDVYKAAEILALLKNKNTKQVLLIGKVEKNHLLKKIKLDWLTIKLLARMLYHGDKAIMEKILETFQKNGIEVLHQNKVLASLIVSPGVLYGTLTKELENNINFGIKIAMSISQHDIGQTVVIKDKMVIAIEAIEGTDACIKRGIQLGEKNVIVCKGASLDQNKKYDLPTLGPATLHNIQPGEIAAIAWQASQTLIADKDNFIKLAQTLNITLVAIQ